MFQLTEANAARPFSLLGLAALLGPQPFGLGTFAQSADFVRPGAQFASRPARPLGTVALRADALEQFGADIGVAFHHTEEKSGPFILGKAFDEGARCAGRLFLLIGRGRSRFHEIGIYIEELGRSLERARERTDARKGSGASSESSPSSTAKSQRR